MTEEEEYKLKEKQRIIDFRHFDIHARNFPDIRDYLSAVNDFINNH
jgi:hypothetical protein